MDENIKEKLRDAMESGKDAVGEMKEVIRNIAKEIGNKSHEEGKDVQNAAAELFTEIGTNLKNLGKSSAEYVQAAFSGALDGLKESAGSDNNHFKSFFNSLGHSVKSLGEAGYFVSKESFKSIKSFFDKKKSGMENEENEKKGSY